MVDTTDKKEEKEEKEEDTDAVLVNGDVQQPDVELVKYKNVVIQPGALRQSVQKHGGIQKVEVL